MKTIARNNGGFILVITLLISLVLMSLTASGLVLSRIDLKTTSHQKTGTNAFYAADMGVSHAFVLLRSAGTGFTSELSNGGTGGALADLGGVQTLNGQNYRFRALGGATGDGYYVRVEDNFDEAPAPDDPTRDTDGIIKIISRGRTAGSERAVEALVKKAPIPTPPDAALAVYGAGPEVELKGNSLVDGKDYNVPASFSCTGSGCNGTLSGEDPITGLYTSLIPDEVEVKGSASIEGDPPQTIGGGQYTAQFWQDLANDLTPVADRVISGGTVAGNQTLGTRDNPQITVITGETEFSGTVDGAGILIVNDEVEFSGSFHFEGLVIVMNNDGEDLEAEFETEGAGTSRIFGAVVVVGDESEVELEGNVRLLYSMQALQNVFNIGSLMRIVAWHEVF